MYTEDYDLVETALDTDLERQPFWVEKWKRWVLIQELSGTERSGLLESCTIIEKKEGGKKEGRLNLKKLYPLMAVLSIRYPHPDYLPEKDHPHYAEYPGAVDEDGNYLRPPLPAKKAGELAFTLQQVGPLNKKSGAVLEKINEIAGKMSGLRPEDLEEKKDDSSTTSEEDRMMGLVEESTEENSGFTTE